MLAPVVGRLRSAAAAAAGRVRPTVAVAVALALVVASALATTVVAHAVAVSGHVGPSGNATAPGEQVPTGASGVRQAAVTGSDQAAGSGSAGAIRARRVSQHRFGPRVPRPSHLISATLLARQDRPLSAHQLAALRHLDGVAHLVVVSEAVAKVDHHPAQTLAVNPTRFRAWTPKLTAHSNPLWRSIAGGELTASFDMAHGTKLPLGGTVPVRARQRHHGVPIRIGAFATVGMGGVDAVVDNHRGRQLGLPQRNAVVISAPRADPLALKAAVAGVLHRGAQTSLLREVVVIRDAGEFMTRTQIATILHAAASRIGKPYVWGAEGPDSFDCSGLVQWSFAKAGIAMPRVSQEQWFTGPHVPYADARPGDLLFWHYDPTDPTNIDHVAIYAGNGMMIVAPHTGLDVMLTPVPTAHMAGVVRVDPAIAAALA